MKSVDVIFLKRILTIRSLIIFTIVIAVGMWSIINANELSVYTDLLIKNMTATFYGTISVVDYCHYIIYYLLPLFVICKFYQQCKGESFSIILIRFRNEKKYEYLVDRSVVAFLTVYLLMTYVVGIVIGHIFTKTEGNIEYYSYLVECNASGININLLFFIFTVNVFIELLVAYLIVKICYAIKENTIWGFVVIVVLHILNSFGSDILRINPICASTLGRYIDIESQMEREFMGNIGNATSQIIVGNWYNVYYLSTLLLITWIIVLTLIYKRIKRK